MALVEEATKVATTNQQAVLVVTTSVVALVGGATKVATTNRQAVLVVTTSVAALVGGATKVATTNPISDYYSRRQTRRLSMQIVALPWS